MQPTAAAAAGVPQMEGPCLVVMSDGTVARSHIPDHDWRCVGCMGVLLGPCGCWGVATARAVARCCQPLAPQVAALPLNTRRPPRPAGCSTRWRRTA